MHHGWAHILLDRAGAWDLIIHGLAHRGANGTVIATETDDQDGATRLELAELLFYYSIWDNWK